MLVKAVKLQAVSLNSCLIKDVETSQDSFNVLLIHRTDVSVSNATRKLVDVLKKPIENQRRLVRVPLIESALYI